MYLVASVRPFVCLSAKGNYHKSWSKGWSLPVQGFCLLSGGARADNLADAVDRHLIFLWETSSVYQGTHPTSHTCKGASLTREGWRGDRPTTGSWVCDGLIQRPLAMKQNC